MDVVGGFVVVVGAFVVVEGAFMVVEGAFVVVAVVPFPAVVVGEEVDVADEAADSVSVKGLTENMVAGIGTYSGLLQFPN